MNPGSQDVAVGNYAKSANTYQSQPIGAGFTFLPLNATLAPGQPTDVHVYPNFSQLAAGSTNHGGITFLFADGTLQTVSVLIVVAPPGVTPNNGDAATQAEGRSLMPRASSSCSGQALQIQYRNIQSGFPAVVGQGINIEAQVSDGCGNLVGPGGQNAQVLAFFNSTSNMTHVGNGIWQGTWTPTGTGPVVVYVEGVQVQPFAAGGKTTALTTTVTSVPSGTSGTSATPLTSAVSHAASQAVGVPIAPGELITVYGANLASGSSTSNTLPLPTTSNGLQVLLGVTPLPILYTSSGQMNVQVPYSVPLNTQYQLSVVTGTSLSVPQTLTVAAATPGIFTVNQAGTGKASS